MSNLQPTKYATSSTISPSSATEYRPVRTSKASSPLIAHRRLAQYIQNHWCKITRPWWAWEIFAAIVSLVATISLIVVLSQVDEHKQQFWAIGGTLLTVNTIVAGLGTVLRTALLLAVAGALNQGAWNWFASSIGKYESEGQPLKDLETFSDASANSWNCIKLLWRTKCRYIVTIGALVMILSLAFDAFLQQILSIEQKPQQSRLTGSNLTANNILPRAATYNGNSDPMPISHWTSIMTAALAQNDGPLPNAVCPTGNCTWPVTPSLATCHECESISPTATTLQSPWRGCTFTNYSLPTLPFYVDSYKHNLTTVQCEDGTGEADWVIFSGTPIYHSPWSLANTTITRLYSFGATPNPKQELGWVVVAYTCSISFCIKGYTGSVSDGLDHMGMVEDFGLESQLIGNNTNGTWNFVNIPTSLNVAELNPITVNESFRTILGRATFELFAGSLNMGPNGGGTGSSNPIVTGVSDLMQHLRNSSGNLKDFTATVGKISDAMTNYIRTTSPEAPNPLYAPLVTISVPIVVVRWPWLTYVLVLQFSGIFFLLLTIRATNRRRVRAWKGHRMALLLAELDPSLQSKAQGGLSHRTGLDECIGEAKVRLEFDGDDGIAFRCVDQELSRKRTLGLEFGPASEVIMYQGV